MGLVFIILTFQIRSQQLNGVTSFHYIKREVKVMLGLRLYAFWDTKTILPLLPSKNICMKPR